jgi:type II secretory pathway component GspD/PulD (secretin)
MKAILLFLTLLGVTGFSALYARPELNAIVDIDFDNVELDVMMKFFSKTMNVNIIKQHGVSVSISAHLAGIPAIDALGIICDTHELSYTLSDNTITIYSSHDYASANLLYEGETSIYSLNYTKAVDIFSKLSGVFSNDIKNGRMLIFPVERTNSIVVVKKKGNIRTSQELRQIISAYDQPTLQVLIEAKIVEITLNRENQYGINWNLLQQSEHPNHFQMPFAGDPRTDGSWDRVWKLKDFTLNGLVTAIGKDTDARVLSNPRLLVINGEEAKIIVGRNEPYSETIKDPLGGSITSTKFVETGIGFTVTPQINEKFVTLTIAPVVSSAAPRADLIVPPVISKSEAKTVVTMADRSTVVIGGLIQEKKSVVITKIPILGDIPYLGYLFSSRQNVKLRSEIILILTTTIIKE